MAFEFTLDLSGLRALESVDFQDDLENTLEEIRRDAEVLAPKKTGRLSRSLRKRSAPDGSGEVFSGVEYALAVEVGSEGRPAQPYLRPAFDKNKNRLTQRMKNRIESV